MILAYYLSLIPLKAIIAGIRLYPCLPSKPASKTSQSPYLSVSPSLSLSVFPSHSVSKPASKSSTALRLSSPTFVTFLALKLKYVVDFTALSPLSLSVPQSLRFFVTSSLSYYCQIPHNNFFFSFAVRVLYYIDINSA